jgi:spore coat protein A, manganese oxidase
MISRRHFLQLGGLAGAGLLIGPRRAWPILYTPPLIPKFTVPLHGLGPTGIPVATADTTTFPGSDYYKIVAGEFRQKFHPAFDKIYAADYPGGFPGTKLWGYADDVASPNHRYLGGLIIANKNRPVRMQMRNNLVDGSGNPLLHPVAPDPTVMDPSVIIPEFAALENRIAVHIHGGHVPWISDGGPFSWFGTPAPGTGIAPVGASKFDVPDMPAPPQGAMTFYYPNDQSARLLWYHDHAYGLTRINAYVGLATGYLLLDPFELSLIKGGFIPDIAHLVPLVLQDKSFVPPGGNKEAGGRGEPGDLYYPSDYNAAGFDTDPPGKVIATPSAVAEFFGDTTVVNGVCYPFLEVEQRRYRFNILNGTQARMFNLQLYVSAPANDPNRNNKGTEIPTVLDSIYGTWQVPDLNEVSPGPKMLQIGTESGFLPFPVLLNKPPAPFTAQVDANGDVIPSTMTYTLLLGGAERADVIIDFSKIPVGTKLILYNDAPGPFPNGDPLADFYTGSVAQGNSHSGDAGFGPNTRTLMQFRVVRRTGKPDPPQMGLLERFALNGLHGRFFGGTQPISMLPILPTLVAKGKPVRRLALYEDFDSHGRLRQLLGDLTGPTLYPETAGEVVQEDAIEVWEIYNATGDTHPIHFHLTDVQILGRAPYVPDPTDPLGRPQFDVNNNPVLAPFRPPDNNERGFKETVRMNPFEVIRVVMKFDLPKLPFKVPFSPRLEAKPYEIKAHEYVWHCHILEHEEHDMMHGLTVVPKRKHRHDAGDDDHEEHDKP